MNFKVIGTLFKRYLYRVDNKEGTDMLTEKKIATIFVAADSKRISLFVKTFNEYCKKFGITEEVHVNFFLAQIREEVGTSLKPRRENLNYSCSALSSIFGYYKKFRSEASSDGRCDNHKANQMNIGNKAYANRIGNGGVTSGDGYRFRGGGYIQLTGRSNYIMASEVITLALGSISTPEEIEKNITHTRGALLTAMAFWSKNRLYECDTIDQVTAKVNKHTDSYLKRKQHYQYIASI